MKTRPEEIISMGYTEKEMEDYLRREGYTIWVGEVGNRTIDSTLVMDYAAELGFKSLLDEETQEYSFIKEDDMEKKIIEIVDYNGGDVIRGQIKVDSDVDTLELEQEIDRYKEECNDWQFDELIDDCVKRLNIKTYDLEKVETINI